METQNKIGTRQVILNLKDHEISLLCEYDMYNLIEDYKSCIEGYLYSGMLYLSFGGKDLNMVECKITLKDKLLDYIDRNDHSGNKRLYDVKEVGEIANVFYTLKIISYHMGNIIKFNLTDDPNETLRFCNTYMLDITDLFYSVIKLRKIDLKDGCLEDYCQIEFTFNGIKFGK